MGAIIDQNCLARTPSLWHHPKYILIYATLLFIPYIHLLQLRYALQKYKVRQRDIDCLKKPNVILDSTAQKSIERAYESHSHFESMCKVVRFILLFVIYVFPWVIEFTMYSLSPVEREWSSLEVLFQVYATVIPSLCGICPVIDMLPEDQISREQGPAFLVSLLHEKESDILQFYALLDAPLLTVIISTCVIEAILFNSHLYSDPNPLNIHLPLGFFMLGIGILILFVINFLVSLCYLLSGCPPMGYYPFDEGMRELNSRLRSRPADRVEGD